MSGVLAITCYGLVAGAVGTGIGGLTAFFVPHDSRKILSVILEYSAGLMIAVVCFDLLPSAFELAGLSVVLTAAFAGLVFGILSDTLVNLLTRRAKGGSLLRAGYVIAMGIALHNFPEGLAIGSGMERDFAMGLSLAIVILLHDIPEGMAMSLPLKSGGTSPRRAALLAFAAGLPMGIGAMAGAYMGSVSDLFVAVSLGAAAGTMLYIVFAEMIPESKKLYGGRLGSLGNILGILSGLLVSYF